MPPASPSLLTSGDVTGAELARYFLRLGATGFGGPIALTGRMHRDLVVQRRWISEEEYREGFALAQLAPGPLAAQLAIHIGWVRGGVRGATLVGICFVAPSFVMVLALSWLYVRAGGTAWIQHVFYGAGAAVIAIIARSAARLARQSLARDRLLWGVFVANALATAWSGTEWIALIAGSGALILVVRVRGRIGGATAAPFFPPMLLPVIATPAIVGGAPSLGGLFWFFAKAGLVVFGSGLAIVPFLYGGAVEQHGWLTEREFLDAVAVSVLTPGPVVITVAFMGYLVAGFSGALVSAAGVFVPTYLVVILLAPRFHRIATSESARAFVDGVTAAATGALAGAVVVLGGRAIADVPALVIALASLGVLAWRPKVAEPLVLLAAAVVGAVVSASR